MKYQATDSSSQWRSVLNSLRTTLLHRSSWSSPSHAPRLEFLLSCLRVSKVKDSSTSHRNRLPSGQLKNSRVATSIAWSQRSIFARPQPPKAEKKSDQFQWTSKSPCIMCRVWQFNTWKSRIQRATRSTILTGGCATLLSQAAMCAGREAAIRLRRI